MSQTRTDTGVKQGTQNITLGDGTQVDLQPYRREVLMVAYPNTRPATYVVPNGQSVSFDGAHMTCINQIRGTDSSVNYDIYGISLEDFRDQSYHAVENRPNVYQKQENVLAWKADRSFEINGRDTSTGQTTLLHFERGDWLVKQPNGDINKFSEQQMLDYYQAA